MRLLSSICVVAGTIGIATILLFIPGKKLAGQTEFRPHSVRGGRPTPETVEQMERSRALLLEGWKVTPAEAAQLEEKLAKDSESLTLRLRLMSYYMQQVMIEKYARHAYWLVEHHPDADALHGVDMMTAIPGAWAEGNAVYQTRLRALWKEQASRFSNNTTVLRNAATAMGSAEPELFLQYVKAARRAEPGNSEWTAWLAKTYANAIRWTYWDGKSMMTFMSDAADHRNYPFMLPLAMCRDVKKEVESSAEAALVGAVGDMLIREAKLIENDSITPDVEQIAAFGEVLAKRARVLQATASGR